MSNTAAADIRKAALNAQVPSETVEVEEWDATITVNGMMTGAAASFYEGVSTTDASGEATVDTQRYGPGLLIACVFDAAGKPVFELADIDMIRSMPAAVTTPLVHIAARLSGLGGKDDDKDVAEDFDDGQ